MNEKTAFDIADDAVQVLKADGTVSTLGADEFDVAQPEPTAQPAKERKLTKAQQQELEIKRRADEKAAKVIADAKAKAAQVRADAKVAAKKLAEEKKAKAAEDKKRKAEEKVAAKKLADEKREQEKKDRAAAKARAYGEVGDPKVDAAYHAAVDKATSLAVQPYNPNTLDLGWLNIPGLVLTATGLKLPTKLGITEWTDVLAAVNGLGNLSAFAVGDALLFGEQHYHGIQYQQVVDRLHLEKQTLKNYKSVAKAFKPSERVAGLSPTHHLEAVGLQTSNPALARNLLQKALEDKLPASWVRAQVAEHVAEQKGEPTKAEQKAKAVDDLVRATDAQRQEDLAALGSEAEIEKAIYAEYLALIDYSTRHDYVPAPAAVRAVTRLNGVVEAITTERDLWKQRYEALAASIGNHAEAQARIAQYEAEDAAAAQVATETVAVGDLSFLDGEATDLGAVPEQGENGSTDEEPEVIIEIEDEDGENEDTDI